MLVELPQLACLKEVVQRIASRRPTLSTPPDKSVHPTQRDESDRAPYVYEHAYLRRRFCLILPTPAGAGSIAYNPLHEPSRTNRRAGSLSSRLSRIAASARPLLRAQRRTGSNRLDSQRCA
jgi:hypothetical protein